MPAKHIFDFTLPIPSRRSPQPLCLDGVGRDVLPSAEKQIGMGSGTRNRTAKSQPDFGKGHRREGLV
jgi:hypothetical protein